MNQHNNLLHVISNLDGYGLSRQLQLLARHQIGLGQQVRIVALGGDRPIVKTWRKEGLDARVLDQRWLRDPFVAARLLAEFRRCDFDLLHLWGQPSVGYARALQKLTPSKPTVTSLPAADLPLGIEAAAAMQQTREEFLAQLNLPQDAKLIAVAGKLTRNQNLDEAIWQFELVRTLDENVRLLIFGDGPDRHRLERFTRLTSDPLAVRFLGYRLDFRELLRHVDLFWHTAEENKTTPLPVLEAMAANVPVVANDIPSCRRIIDHAQNGYLVPDNDRAVFARYTRMLLHDQQHREAIVSSAEPTANQFRVKAMLDTYAQRYENCCAIFS